MINISDMVFLKDKDWYTKNSKGELILTEKAPPEAVTSYTKAQREYWENDNGKIDFDIIEDEGWLIFPSLKNEKMFSKFAKSKK